MIYCTSFGLILGSILSDIFAIKFFYSEGEWSIPIFFGQIASITMVCFIIGLMLFPIYYRIKHNLLVRNRDHSVASVIRNIGRILICAGPMIASFGLVFAGVSEGLAKLILFVGILTTSAITGAFAKRRNAKIEKSLREGLKNNPNIEAVFGNSITDFDIMDCVSCDSINRKKNFIIKHDVSDIHFATLDYVTRVSKNSDEKDPAEVICYKTNKVTKSPIICTFDKELTDAPMQLIETENPEFNKQFFTYCDNAQDAFYILTPQVMERMIDAAKIYKRLIFNFDTNELFIIVYQDKFMNALADNDSQTAFGDLNKMLDDLVFKDIAQAGVHVQRKSNASKVEPTASAEVPKKKKKIWRIVLVALAILFVCFFVVPGIVMCSTINGTTSSKSGGSYSKEVTPEDYAPIQTYLNQKYGLNFNYDSSEYNSVWDSDFSHTVYAHFIDPNGIKFEGHSNILNRDSKNIEFSDSYQTVQFNKAIEKQIMSLNPCVDDVRISDTYFTEKFNSIDQYLAIDDCLFISVFLKSDFGDINDSNSLDLSKTIINNTKIPNAFINFYTYDTYNLKVTYRYKDGEYYIS